MTALKIFRIPVLLQIPTAIYAASMSWLSLELLHIEDFPLIIFVFWATLCSYNFHKWINIYYRNTKDDIYPSGNIYLMFSILSLIILAFYREVFIKHYCIFSVAACCTILYTLPNLPQKPFRWLRKIAFAKTFFLAAVWTFITVLIPFEIHMQTWKPVNTIFILQRFTFIYAICILFDERDKNEDIHKGIRSISTMFHPRWIAWIYFLTIISSLIFSFLLKEHYLEIAIATSIPSFIALFLFDRYKGESPIYYTVFLDGLMALPAFFHFVSQFDLFLQS